MGLSNLLAVFHRVMIYRDAPLLYLDSVNRSSNSTAIWSVPAVISTCCTAHKSIFLSILLIYFIVSVVAFNIPTLVLLGLPLLEALYLDLDAIKAALKAYARNKDIISQLNHGTDSLPNTQYLPRKHYFNSYIKQTYLHSRRIQVSFKYN
jgi:hypothetical protein